MDTMIERMLEPYGTATLQERKHALREVAQEVILCGLSRAGFFNGAAFCGGTALRMFYGLDRFSEDMDFSLITPDKEFDLEKFLPTVEKECAAWGLRLTASVKPKSHDSAIRSAFLKANTKEHLLNLFSDDGIADALAPGELMRIKLEIDTDPAPFATFQREYRLLPAPFEVNLFDAPSLFAGKTHAVLCRAWKSRVKGRDLYDYVFYLSQGTPLNTRYLSAKLIQTGHIEEGAQLDLEVLRDMLDERFDHIDYKQAKEDVAPFLSDVHVLDVWSADFFKSITRNLCAVETL